MEVERIRGRWNPEAAVVEPEITQEEGEAGVRLVLRLFERWGLSDREARVLLGGVSARTYARWKAGEIGRLETDRKMRLSLLAGIHKALRSLFTEPERAYGWVTRPNADFGGHRPLDVLLQGRMTDLLDVRAYLDAARG